jgi:hypothetical protein
MVNLLFTILTLTIALLFARYVAHYIVYLYAKFIKIISKGKINMILHPITKGDILSTIIFGLILSSIFKIVGII